jgi:hypothetical protein
LAAALEAAAQADAERAHAEGVAHKAALASIDTEHRAVLDTIAGIARSRVDALARRAVERAIEVG